MKEYLIGLRKHYYEMSKNVIKFVFWIPAKLLDFLKRSAGYIILIAVMIILSTLNVLSEIILNISFESVIQKIINDVDRDESFMRNDDYFTDKTMHAFDWIFEKIDKCFE